MESRVSTRYAKALLGLSDQADNSKQIAQQFSTISNIIADNKELQELIQSKTLPLQVKRNTLLSVFSGSDKLINNTIEVLLKNKRIALLQDVAQQYISLYEKANGIQKATVTTAIPIDEATEKKVQEKILLLTGKEALLKNTVDSSIIGGFILRIGDLQYNASVKNQLLSIKQELSN